MDKIKRRLEKGRVQRKQVAHENNERLKEQTHRAKIVENQTTDLMACKIMENVSNVEDIQERHRVIQDRINRAKINSNKGSSQVNVTFFFDNWTWLIGNNRAITTSGLKTVNVRRAKLTKNWWN